MKYAEPEKYRHMASSLDVNKEISVLKGLLKGIIIDGTINQEEISELKNWCQVNAVLYAKEPYKSIVTRLVESIDDETLMLSEVEKYIQACDKVAQTGKSYNQTTCKLQELLGIFHGILADNEINDDEVMGLRSWIYDHDYLSSTYPYDEINALVVSTFEDGIIIEDERLTLKGFMGMFVNIESSLHLHKDDLVRLSELYNVKGICALNPKIQIAGKTFCFTGSSIKYKRDEIAAMIVSRGGAYLNGVSNKIDYLIYGDKSSPSWAYTCFGRKIEQVVELRKAGGRIQIINEHDFWDAISD